MQTRNCRGGDGRKRKCKHCKREWHVSIKAEPIKHYVCPWCRAKARKAS